MVYKNTLIDLECLYMPELLVEYGPMNRPCVAHLPDIERGFSSVEEAKKFIDENLESIQAECDANSKKHGIPF